MTQLIQAPRNTVLKGHVVDRLKELPDACVDGVYTSPPYYGKRDYGQECVTIWGGRIECEHDWQKTEMTLQHENRNSLVGSQEECVGQTGTAFIKKFDKLEAGYCSKCGAWKGQLGLEPHPQMFIDHLVMVFSEVKRVLKPSGSLWLNLGDTYFGGNGKAGRPEGWQDLENNRLSAHAPEDFIRARNKLRSNWLQPKQKLLIPHRVAIALMDDLGFVLRNDVIWHKINHMPESCRNRFASSFEYVFFFVKNTNPLWSVNTRSGLVARHPPAERLEGIDYEIIGCPKCEGTGKIADKPCGKCKGKGKIKDSFWESHDYYFDLDGVRKPLAPASISRAQGNYLTFPKDANGLFAVEKKQRWAEKTKASYALNNPHRMRENPELYGVANADNPSDLSNPMGANPGDVFSLTNEALKEEHYAAYPKKLVRLFITASAPMWICNECGLPKIRIVKNNGYIEGNGGHVCRKIAGVNQVSPTSIFHTHGCNVQRSSFGWSKCSCNKGFHSALLLDPFAGAGTTLLVAHEMGYDWLGIEAVSKNCDIINRRLEKHGRIRLDGFMPSEAVVNEAVML